MTRIEQDQVRAQILSYTWMFIYDFDNYINLNVWLAAHCQISFGLIHVCRKSTVDKLNF